MERQYYLWTAGGSTVSVAFAPAFMKRLRQAASDANGAEIGGILLGLREADDEITIEDFELLPSEHRRGATFTLSQQDRKKLSQRLRASHYGLETVGSFRTHLRQGMYMDQYDFDLMSSHFAGSSDVMLLIRPNDWQAGLFVWEEGDIHRQKSYREFPFNPELLPLTPVTVQTTDGARTKVILNDVVKQQRKSGPSLISRKLLPTLAKVALIAATFGLVGVLAHHYTQEHKVAAATVARVSAADSQRLATRTPPPSTEEVNPPVDPDVSRQAVDLSEMHVKVPVSDTRPSPFTRTSQGVKTDPTSPVQSSPVKVDAEPAIPPAPPPPIQTAVNLPPAIGNPSVLKPAPQQLVSVVSLEPAEPGVLSRGINRIPVVNLLQRHKYRAGEKFLPARPARQVKPKLPIDWQRDNGHPPPVDVKVWIDKTGQVTRAELLSDSKEPDVADIAANAALKWTFEPARLADRPVSSEMVMHFSFAPKQNY